MIFNTWDYYILFLVPSAILFRIASPRVRPWVIVASGSLFFVYFSYTQFGGIIGACCLAIILWECLVSRFYKSSSWLCFAGVAQAVAFLVLFKYRNFLTGLWWPVAEKNPLYWRNSFLPLGISFFTFEFIHYAVDRYQSKTEEGTVGEYLAFILFFPTMVAGPIKRYQDFLPKQRSISTDWALDWQRAVTRILAGLVKKFAIADLLTAYTSHLNWMDISRAQRGILPLWLFAYGIQIYVDFSAYSDIAIGSARLFGIRVPENFDWPYLRANITDFWRHWHMSLTNWLIDYIYIPLGGSRVRGERVYANILATMLISGIWHGAGVHFIVWGLLHGVMLAIRRLWRQLHPAPLTTPFWPKASAWLLTYVCVNLAWAFFCMDVRTAIFFFRRLLIG
jgi:alginate O-acetyltransferase complex protein AlgI